MKKVFWLVVLCIGLSGCGIQPINKESEEEMPVEEVVEVEEESKPIEVEETEPVQEEVVKSDPLIKITGDILNVRDIPTVVDSTKLGVVLEDSVYKILKEAKDEENRVWYQIEYDTNLTGWVAGWFTELYENPNNYKLTADQWKDYNNIQKGINNNGWYKSLIKKDMLYRSLVYDFDKDGEMDSVYFDLKLGEIEPGDKAVIKSEIIYKDQTLVFEYVDNGEYGWGLTELGVMDVNQADDTVEFYIKEGDLSDRVLYSIYRIENGILTQVTTMYGEILAINGDGRIYYWGGQLIEPNDASEHDPALATSYYDIEQRTYMTTDDIIGAKVPVTWKVILYKTKNDVLDGAPLEFDQMVEMSEGKRVTILEAGLTMTVLEHDHMTSRTKVSTDNGYEGWIGGFHMVWD